MRTLVTVWLAVVLGCISVNCFALDHVLHFNLNLYNYTNSNNTVSFQKLNDDIMIEPLFVPDTTLLAHHMSKTYHIMMKPNSRFKVTFRGENGDCGLIITSSMPHSFVAISSIPTCPTTTGIFINYDEVNAYIGNKPLGVE